MRIDYIIVGQGLAGTILSYQLLKRGKSVVVIDNESQLSSSSVAAGIFNPITGRKLVKTWQADTIFPYLIGFYKELETFLNKKFLFEKPIYRPFFNIEQQNEWMGMSAETKMTPFVEEIRPNNQYGSFIDDPFGGLELKSCGYVDIASLLGSYREYLRQQRMLIESDFYLPENPENEFMIGDINAGEVPVIYCNGPTFEKGNPFEWLPFRRVKGEILIIEPEWDLPVIFNKGIFILPLENGHCKVGATYDWKDLTWEITSSGKDKLVGKMDSLFKGKYKIIDHVAGVRPATIDRKPFIGTHPTYPKRLIFNGFGTKGVSLMPFFSEKFCNNLLNNEELPIEVNISRYFSLY